MAKFKVGDIIKANEKANQAGYLITNKKNSWTGKVLAVKADDCIRVTTLSPERYKGETYTVKEKCFNLAKTTNTQNKKGKTMTKFKVGDIVDHRIEGNVITVILDGGRKGIAKCNPADKFNLAFGTALAVARAYGDKETEAKLLAEPVEPVKEEPKFKVGELVRIRQWDDMEKEFGTNDIGDILCENGFIKEMYPLCGLYAEIVSLDKDGRVGLKFFNCEGSYTGYTYSTDMIEKV